jgi:hypothetical protein
VIDPSTVRTTIRAILVVVPFSILHAFLVAEKPHYVQPDVAGYRGFEVDTSHDDMFSVAWRARNVAAEATLAQAEARKVVAEADTVRTQALLGVPP